MNPALTMSATSRTRVMGRERTRRRIVTLVLVFLWVLLLEGVARKWLFPSIQHVVYFARDPIVFAIYVLALSRGFVPGRSKLLNTGILLAIFGILVASLQVLDNQYNVPIYIMAFGWRSYFAYMILPFVMLSAFTEKDVLRLFKHLLLAVPATAVLMVMQAHYSELHWLNAGLGIGKDAFYNLGVAKGFVRPFGTFTSDLAARVFIAAAAAILVANWMIPSRERMVRKPMLLILSLSLLVALGVSGSRGAYIHVGLIVVAAVVFTFVSTNAKAASRGLTVPVVLVVVFVSIVPNVFPHILDAFIERWTGAQVIESKHYYGGILGRMFAELAQFVPVMDDVPITGAGLGMGTNAATRLGIVPVDFPVVETDWARHVVDLGPILGAFFIVWRVAFTIYIGTQSLRLSRISGNPLPLLMFALAGPVLLHFQITGHGQLQAFGWLLVGINLVILNVYRKKEQVKGC